MADVKWIKITTNIFDDEKIKLIDTMPDRDTLLVIWFKLLSMAGKTNDNGLVYIIKEMPTTDEMLATIFNRPLNTVRMALEIFSKFKMIEINKHVNIINWEKHQNIDGLDKIREQNRIRQEKHREKKKQQLLENKNNVTVTLSNGTDKELELDKEEDKDNIITNNKSEEEKLTKEQKEYRKNLEVYKEKIRLEIMKYNFNVTVEKLLQYAEGDYNLVLRQFKYFASKGLRYFIASIKDKYPEPRDIKPKDNKIVNPEIEKQKMKEQEEFLRMIGL